MKKKTDFTDKPYNRCLTCPNRKVRCDGPRTSSMELSRWCEFIRDMKDVNGLTNAYIAEKSGVSIKTIERIMALNCDQDIMRETARRIENAVIGSSNQHPCIMAFEAALPQDATRLNEALKDLEHALDDNKGYKTALENIHASYNAEMQTIRVENQQTVDILLKEIDGLKKAVEYLRLENDRKAKIIDKFLDS